MPMPLAARPSVAFTPSLNLVDQQALRPLDRLPVPV
jgi:hypothetical protein